MEQKTVAVTCIFNVTFNSNFLPSIETPLTIMERNMLYCQILPDMELNSDRKKISK